MSPVSLDIDGNHANHAVVIAKLIHWEPPQHDQCDELRSRDPQSLANFQRGHESKSVTQLLIVHQFDSSILHACAISFVQT